LQAFDQLDLVAEVAAALLGFIAVFLALSRSDGRFSQSDRHFIQALVMTSATAIILALAPRSISLFVADDVVWYAASILAITLGTMAMLLQVSLQRRMAPNEAVQIHWLWHLSAWMLSAASGILFILAIFDSVRTTAYYVSGVSLMIPLCLLVFIGVVFRRFF